MWEGRFWYVYRKRLHSDDTVIPKSRLEKNTQLLPVLNAYSWVPGHFLRKPKAPMVMTKVDVLDKVSVIIDYQIPDMSVRSLQIIPVYSHQVAPRF